MIHPHEITIGSLIRTNEGEIIRVETITSKAKHRKVGYHPKDRPTYMRYTRLAQCEGIELTIDILKDNGFQYAGAGRYYYGNGETGDYACVTPTPKDLFYVYVAEGYHLVFQRFQFQYVHELQLSLICAGLHELTDNIKI